MASSSAAAASRPLPDVPPASASNPFPNAVHGQAASEQRRLSMTGADRAPFSRALHGQMESDQRRARLLENEKHRQASQRRRSDEPDPFENVYGSSYSYDEEDAESWGYVATDYDPYSLNVEDVRQRLQALDGETSLTAEQMESFATAFEIMANKHRLVPQETLRYYLHHLQERRHDYYVYMYSETQAAKMMPSLREQPNGMTFSQFLNIMYFIHKDTGWSAERILNAFATDKGHYGAHPGKRRNSSGCIVS